MKMSKNHKSWQNVEILYRKEMVVTFLFVEIQKNLNIFGFSMEVAFKIIFWICYGTIG